MKSKKEEKEELKITLIGFAIAGLLMVIAGTYTAPKLDIEKGIIWDEPVFYPVHKNPQYRFSIKEVPDISYKIRLIYPYLNSHQKEKIEILLKRNTPVEVYIDNQEINKDRQEVYAIIADRDIIFGLKDYEALKKRELISGIIWVILFLSLFFLYTKSKWKNRSCLIHLLMVLGIFIILFYLRKG